MPDYIADIRGKVGNDPLILCSAGVILYDQDYNVLLQKRKDNDLWGLPGGLMELGESIEETARREVFEETGLNVLKMRLLNVYSGMDQHYIYPNGDEAYFVNVIYYSNQYTGSLVADNLETKELKYFSILDLPKRMLPTNKPFLEDFKQKFSDRVKESQ